jgi:hypothetical protein
LDQPLKAQAVSKITAGEILIGGNENEVLAWHQTVSTASDCLNMLSNSATILDHSSWISFFTKR